MNDKKEDGNRRREYNKPELRRVELKPEESLAAGCKTLAGGGGAGPCELTSCFFTGS